MLEIPQLSGRETVRAFELVGWKVVICGGMGQGAYASIAATGKKIFMVNHLNINQTLDTFLKCDLKSSENLVH